MSILLTCVELLEVVLRHFYVAVGEDVCSELLPVLCSLFIYSSGCHGCRFKNVCAHSRVRHDDIAIKCTSKQYNSTEADRDTVRLKYCTPSQK